MLRTCARTLLTTYMCSQAESNPPPFTFQDMDMAAENQPIYKLKEDRRSLS
jgi:hypothetical protein